MSWLAVPGVISGLGAAAWAPSDLSAVVAWYRADLGVTESGGLVSAWADQIGSNDLAQGNSTYQPTLVSSDSNFNSQSSLSFSGDVVYSAASSWWHIADGTSLTSIVVWRATSLAAAGYPLNTRNFTTQGGWGHRADLARFYVADSGASSTDFASDSTGYSTSTVYVSAGIMRENGASADDISLWINGTECDAPVVGSYSFGDIAAASARAFLVGAAGTTGGSGLVGHVAEVIYVAGLLSSGEDASLTSYLNSRYGLSLTGVTQ